MGREGVGRRGGKGRGGKGRGWGVGGSGRARTGYDAAHLRRIPLALVCVCVCESRTASVPRDARAPAAACSACVGVDACDRAPRARARAKRARAKPPWCGSCRCPSGRRRRWCRCSPAAADATRARRIVRVFSPRSRAECSSVRERVSCVRGTAASRGGWEGGRGGRDVDLY